MSWLSDPPRPLGLSLGSYRVGGVALSVNWDAELRLLEWQMWAGPEDEFDDEANGDPDSCEGEEDEAGFDDDPFGVEPLFEEDDGFDDAEGSEDDEDEEC